MTGQTKCAHDDHVKTDVCPELHTKLKINLITQLESRKTIDSLKDTVAEHTA